MTMRNDYIAGYMAGPHGRSWPIVAHSNTAGSLLFITEAISHNNWSLLYALLKRKFNNIIMDTSCSDLLSLSSSFPYCCSDFLSLGHVARWQYSWLYNRLPASHHGQTGWAGWQSHLLLITVIKVLKWQLAVKLWPGLWKRGHGYPNYQVWRIITHHNIISFQHNYHLHVTLSHSVLLGVHVQGDTTFTIQVTGCKVQCS